MPGTFAANEWDYGMFYQWDKNIGWSSVDPIINSNGGTSWDNSGSPNTGTWTTFTNPCPQGWKIPDVAALNALIAQGSSYTTSYLSTGIAGRVFGTAPNIVFLPAAGFRNSTGALIALTTNTSGFYWGNISATNTTASGLQFTILGPGALNFNKEDGYFCRCVKE
jgi:uncharacterized protein (TIGR02145 family)